MKRFNSLIRVDGKFEHLSTYANNNKHAETLVNEAYEGFKRQGYIKDFKVIYAWKEAL